MLGVSALLLGAMGVSSNGAQDPGKPAPPAEVAAPTPASLEPALQQRVSVKFENAPLAEVLKWLQTNGVSFVIDQDSIPRDKRVTINIVNQPLDDVMEAIAAAFGGAWERHGSVYSFNDRFRAFIAPGAAMEGIPKIHMKELEELGPEMHKHLSDIMKNIPEIDMKMLEGMGELKAIPKIKLEQMPELKDLDKKIREGVELKLKGLEDLKGLDTKIHGDLELKLKNMEDLKGLETKIRAGELEGLDKKIRGEVELKMKELDKETKLMESLTPSQWEKHEKHGYLTPADLTPAQREILGDLPKNGNWSITYVIDGKKLSLRAK
jgi:hypothetical protein